MSAISDVHFTPRTKEDITGVIGQNANILKCTNEGMASVGACIRIRMQFKDMGKWTEIEKRPSFRQWVEQNAISYIVSTDSSWIFWPTQSVCVDVLTTGEKAGAIFNDLRLQEVGFRDLRGEEEPVSLIADQVLFETQ